MKHYLVLLLMTCSAIGRSQIVVTFKDSTFQVVDKIFNDDFPTPTHCFSFGAGALWHARFYFEHYTQSNSILHANIAGGAAIGETKFNSLYSNVDFIQNFTPLKFDRSVRVVTKQTRDKIYVAKVPAKLNHKIGLRGTAVFSFYSARFDYRNQLMYGTNSAHLGVGLNLSIVRYTHLILKEQETGSANETRLFFIPTIPVLMRFDSADAGWTRMRMKTVNEYYQYPSRWGWRAGIEYKIFTAFGFKNYLVGINAYFLVEQNHYYAIGTGDKPMVYEANPRAGYRRSPRSFVVGFGYSFMRKATHFDDIKFTD